jgi:hypothetical protein
VVFVLEPGARRQIRNREGLAALEMARKLDLDEIVSLLTGCWI